MNFFRTLIVLLPVFYGCSSDSSSDITPQAGKGGSMARFAITGNSLYIVDKQSLNLYDISDPGDPKKKSKTDLGFGIETIYPYRDHLFIGAADGLYIFDNTDPSAPSLITKYWHVQSCDPVVVQDNYAYVTLRGGTVCRAGGSASSLDVVDLSNLSAPKMVYTQTLTSPYGLGVSGKHLFVCEGSNGLKVYNLEDPKSPVSAGFYPQIPAYDVIIRNTDSFILTGSKGLYQFRFYEEPGKLTQLSRIPVL